MTSQKGNIASNCSSGVIFCQEKKTVDKTSEKEVFRETAKSIEEKPNKEEKNSEQAGKYKVEEKAKKPKEKK